MGVSQPTAKQFTPGDTLTPCAEPPYIAQSAPYICADWTCQETTASHPSRITSRNSRGERHPAELFSCGAFGVGYNSAYSLTRSRRRVSSERGQAPALGISRRAVLFG